MCSTGTPQLFTPPSRIEDLRIYLRGWGTGLILGYVLGAVMIALLWGGI